MASWGFLGAGNLAEAIISGALQKKLLSPDEILITNRTPAKSQSLSKKTGVTIAQHNHDLISRSDIIFIGIKPLEIGPALEELKAHRLENKIIVSLATGVTLKTLNSYAGRARCLCRVMANTPVTIGQGVFGIAYSHFDKPGREQIDAFFAKLGLIVDCKNDRDIDVITSASGSTVGFALMIMEQVEKFFLQKGFSSEQSRNAVVETFLGTSLLAKQRPQDDLKALRAAVTSAKGTTLAGLTAMKKAKVASGLKSGLDAAFLRAQEIAKSLRKSLN